MNTSVYFAICVYATGTYCKQDPLTHINLVEYICMFTVMVCKENGMEWANVFNIYKIFTSTFVHK